MDERAETTILAHDRQGFHELESGFASGIGGVGSNPNDARGYCILRVRGRHYFDLLAGPKRNLGSHSGTSRREINGHRIVQDHAILRVQQKCNGNAGEDPTEAPGRYVCRNHICSQLPTGYSKRITVIPNREPLSF
jgi:hypothetical protein